MLGTWLGGCPHQTALRRYCTSEVRRSHLGSVMPFSGSWLQHRKQNISCKYWIGLLQSGSIMIHDIAYSTAVTEAKHRCKIKPSKKERHTISSPHGWAIVYCENFRENSPCYNGTTLYMYLGINGHVRCNLLHIQWTHFSSVPVSQLYMVLWLSLYLDSSPISTLISNK